MSPNGFIARVVRSFYDRARQDVLIGYHFQRISDFDSHLPRIFAFWELQLLGQTQIELDGPLDVINAHIPLKIHRGEVGRWVKLFEETLEAEKQRGMEDLASAWRAKVQHFQRIFLASPLLFP